MHILSHTSYPSLLFIIIAKLVDIQYALFDILILIFFSILPDLDFLFHRFVKKKKFNLNFRHHKWFTHWPITYIPLLVLLYFYPNFILFLICYGIYSHLILDTFLCGDGIRWFYPFSKKFFNFFPEKTRGWHGNDWLKIYKKTLIYKIDIIAFVILLIVLFNFINFI